MTQSDPTIQGQGIRPFAGDALVAFVDLVGFKHLMAVGRGPEALETFHKVGQLWVQAGRIISGLFVFDSGVAWVEGARGAEAFNELLTAIHRIMRTTVLEGLVPTCSIAYGHFEYRRTVRSSSVEQHILIGDAYVSAFSDNSMDGHKTPVARILKPGLPEELERMLAQPSPGVVVVDQGMRYDYYWMLDSADEIGEFLDAWTRLEVATASHRYSTTIQLMLKAIRDKDVKTLRRRLGPEVKFGDPRDADRKEDKSGKA